MFGLVVELGMLLLLMLLLRVRVVVGAGTLMLLLKLRARGAELVMDDGLGAAIDTSLSGAAGARNCCSSCSVCAVVGDSGLRARLVVFLAERLRGFTCSGEVLALFLFLLGVHVVRGMAGGRRDGGRGVPGGQGNSNDYIYLFGGGSLMGVFYSTAGRFETREKRILVKRVQ